MLIFYGGMVTGFLLLEMLIFYGGMVTGFLLSVVSPSVIESLACPFIGSRGGRDVGGALGAKFCRAL
jgi:hypothetical protein